MSLFLNDSPLIDETSSSSSTVLLPPRPISTLSPHKSERLSLRRKDRLPAEEETFWEIESGYIRSVTWNGNGIVTTLGIWGPGEQICTGLSTIQPLHVECLTPVRLRRNLNESACPCLELLAHRARCMEELLCLLQTRCTKQRLHRTLSWLAHRFGRPLHQGQLLVLQLTHQTLAELVGSSRVTVTRLMQQLRREDVIELRSRAMVIKPWKD